MATRLRSEQSAAAEGGRPRRRYAWADLLHRVFAVEVGPGVSRLRPADADPRRDPSARGHPSTAEPDAFPPLGTARTSLIRGRRRR